MLFQSGDSQQRVIQEVMHDPAKKHDFSKQIELHEKIRKSKAGQTYVGESK